MATRFYDFEEPISAYVVRAFTDLEGELRTRRISLETPRDKYQNILQYTLLRFISLCISGGALEAMSRLPLPLLRHRKALHRLPRWTSKTFHATASAAVLLLLLCTPAALAAGGDCMCELLSHYLSLLPFPPFSPHLRVSCSMCVFLHKVGGGGEKAALLRTSGNDAANTPRRVGGDLPHFFAKHLIVPEAVDRKVPPEFFSTLVNFFRSLSHVCRPPSDAPLLV